MGHGSHTKTHPELGRLTYFQIEDELVKSKKELASFGYQTESIVYPRGSFNDNVLALTSKYYRCGVGTEVGLNNTPIDQYNTKQYSIAYWDDFSDYSTKLNAAKEKNKMQSRPLFDESWTERGNITDDMKKEMIEKLKDRIGYVI